MNSSRKIFLDCNELCKTFPDTYNEITVHLYLNGSIRSTKYDKHDINSFANWLKSNII